MIQSEIREFPPLERLCTDCPLVVRRGKKTTKARCEVCRNRGVVLTPFGKEMIRFIKDRLGVEGGDDGESVGYLTESWPY